MTNERDIIFNKMQHISDSFHSLRRKTHWDELQELGFIIGFQKSTLKES